MQSLKDRVAAKIHSSAWPKELSVHLTDDIKTPGRQSTMDVLQCLDEHYPQGMSVLQVGGRDGGAMAAQALICGAKDAHLITMYKPLFNAFNELCEMGREVTEIGPYNATITREMLHALEADTKTYDLIYAFDLLEYREPKKALDQLLEHCTGLLFLRKVCGTQTGVITDESWTEPINRWLPTKEVLEATLESLEQPYSLHEASGCVYITIYMDGGPLKLETPEELPEVDEVPEPEPVAEDESAEELEPVEEPVVEDEPEDEPEPEPEPTIESSDGTKIPVSMDEIFGTRTAEILVEAGYASVDDVPRSQEMLVAINGIGFATAKKILAALED